MPSRRSLQTILFTDIVGSTERATELGDRRWRELQTRHHRIVREELGRWCGREVTEAGDGFLALFDDPARAIVCAHRVRDRVRELGLEIRCGLHMGQAEREPDGSAGGIAVHIGARVAGQAAPGEVLVTSAVRDAETGSGFTFEDLGPHELKGIERPWRLFRVSALPEDAARLAPGTWDRLRYHVGPKRAAALAGLAAFLAVAAYVALWSSSPGAAIASEIRSLAVLPLDNFSGDPEQEYFAEGMTEALITELSKIGSLQVISRSSAMRYKESEKPLQEIAEELGVPGIVEGSVMRAGDRVRISVQLIHAGTDTHLWAESYDGDVADVLRLQSEVARAIAREIEIALTPEEAARLASSRPVDPEAYEAYLRGTFHLHQMSPEGIEKGLAYLHEAVEKDPGSPLPYAGLARGFSLLASHSPDPPPDAFQRAQAAYRRALELDPTIAEAHAAVAERKLYLERDWEGAEQSFRRAIELNPSLPGAHAHYAWYLNLFDRQEEAVAEMRRAIQVDPLTPIYAAWMADIHSFGDDYDQALIEVRRVFELDPNFPWAYFSLGMAYAGKGMYEEAIAAHEKRVAAGPGWKWALGVTYAQAGRTQEARRIAAELEADVDPLKALGVALIYTALGEEDEAFRWLAYEPAHPWVPWIRTWPGSEPLHDDPRFQNLLDRFDLLPVPPRGEDQRVAVRPS
jgi:adenylate cyclase